MRLGIRTIACVIVGAASICGADRQVQSEELPPPTGDVWITSSNYLLRPPDGADRQVQSEELPPPTGDVWITSSNYLLRPPDASRSHKVSPMAQECVERKSQRSAIMGARRLTHSDNNP
jgi:hypothetical protein